MILACQKITKAFGGDTILNNINFLINEGEKAALIGINGAGKTTLLKIITGEYEADGGEVVLQKGATMGYLSQVIDVTSRRTIYEEMLDAKKRSSTWNRISALWNSPSAGFPERNWKMPWKTIPA